jgi:integrase
MLRHTTGFYLANVGQDTRAIQLYLGHKNIHHTVRYSEFELAAVQGFLEGLGHAVRNRERRQGVRGQIRVFRFQAGRGR